MSFSDLPHIDRFSRNEDLSERRLADWINQSTGFIPRTDVPDKGCDWDIELILSNGSASNWRFGLQLKSIESPSVIEDGRYISYSFETSRLGYLARRTPGMGLVVLYSVPDDVLYFDYVDAIYYRLMEERGSDEWKANEKVNIRIPVTQTLGPESVTDIHLKFCQRFEQAQKLQAAHGGLYNLPIVDFNDSGDWDLNNPAHVKELLLEYGFLMVGEFDTAPLHPLIASLPHHDIAADKNLMLLAALIYCDSGQHMESKLYIEKLGRRGDLTNGEQEIVSFTKLKNNLSLGDLSPKSFVEALRGLSAKTELPQNQVIFELNILFFDLVTMKALQYPPPELLRATLNLFQRIENLPGDGVYKKMLTAWNAQNFSLLIAKIRTDGFAEYRFRESIGRPMTLEERKDLAQCLVDMSGTFFAILGTLDRYAEEHKDSQLKANVLSLSSRFQLSMQFDLVAHDIPAEIVVADANQVSIGLGHAVAAYNIFWGLNKYRDAHSSLCDSLELLHLSRHVYHLEDDLDLEILQRYQKTLEETHGFPAYKLQTPLLLERQRAAKKSPEEDLSFVKGFDDEQLENFGRMVARSIQLPQHLFANLLSELKSCRLFYQRAPAELAIETFAGSADGTWSQYEQPSQFVLRSKTTGVATAPSTDVDFLLRSWGY